MCAFCLCFSNPWRLGVNNKLFFFNPKFVLDTFQFDDEKVISRMGCFIVMHRSLLLSVYHLFISSKHVLSIKHVLSTKHAFLPVFELWFIDQAHFINQARFLCFPCLVDIMCLVDKACTVDKTCLIDRPSKKRDKAWFFFILTRNHSIRWVLFGAKI